MPEEIFGNLKDEDIMWPEPSQEQIALWEEIKKNTSKEVLEKEVLFNALSEDIKNMLSSGDVSKKLIKIGQNYNLSKNQIVALSRYIRNLFTDLSDEEIVITKLINSLSVKIDTSLENAQKIFQDVNKQILLLASKNISFEKEPEQKPSPKEEENANIIDLKNK